MLLIKKFLPKNVYEKEALLKAFLIFFLTIETLVGVIFLLLVKISVEDKKQSIFLELVNYSYTFRGKDFKVELYKVKSGKEFYKLKEDERGLFIVIPIPGVKEDALKIIYPKEKFREDVKEILKSYLTYFGFFTAVNLFVSYILALYTISPLRKAINLIAEVSRDISHDMNTPITSILINLNILKNRYDENAVKRIEMAVNQLKYLRENLSPLEKKIHMKLEEVNLKELIEESLNELSQIYGDIKVYTELKNIKVLADKNVVKRIIDNLLSNAFKHNIKNGYVKVITEDKKLIIENTSKPVKDVNKIFEPFYRESERGTGLGLSVVKKLSQELGWKIEANYGDGVFKIVVKFV